jgi:hypothetical protein
MRGSPSTCSTRQATRISAEDTYRTLTAVDRAGDGARRRQGHRGADQEALRGCQLRDVPIITFVNKLDREGRATKAEITPPSRSPQVWRKRADLLTAPEGSIYKPIYVNYFSGVRRARLSSRHRVLFQ